MTIALPAEIFKAYDIRGIVGKTLTPEICRAVGQALGLGHEVGRRALQRDDDLHRLPPLGAEGKQRLVQEGQPRRIR